MCRGSPKANTTTTFHSAPPEGRYRSGRGSPEGKAVGPPVRPRENKVWLDDLREVAAQSGINDLEKITFHGWRHFFTTYMYSEVKEGLLQKATVRKTIEMLRHYANHERDYDASEIQGALRKVFEPILRVGRDVE